MLLITASSRLFAQDRTTIKMPVENDVRAKVSRPLLGFAMRGQLVGSADGKTLAWSGAAMSHGPIVQVLDIETGRPRITMRDDDLKRADGKEIALPIQRLSKSDQEYLQQRGKTR